MEKAQFNPMVQTPNEPSFDQQRREEINLTQLKVMRELRNEIQQARLDIAELRRMLAEIHGVK
jgi:hypothetical protein